MDRWRQVRKSKCPLKSVFSLATIIFVVVPVQVCLQLPDYMLDESVAISSEFETLLGRQVYILGDTSYGRWIFSEPGSGLGARPVKKPDEATFGFRQTLSTVKRLVLKIGLSYGTDRIRLKPFAIFISKTLTPNEHITLQAWMLKIQIKRSIKRSTSINSSTGWSITSSKSFLNYLLKHWIMDVYFGFKDTE